MLLYFYPTSANSGKEPNGKILTMFGGMVHIFENRHICHEKNSPDRVS
jgi:hypothetical protein